MPKVNRFTLVEMLVVGALLSLISLVLVPVLEHSRALARDSGCRANQASLYQACASYHMNFGTFPVAMKGLWIEPLAEFLHTDREGIKNKFTCPERANLGIVRMKSDYGLNFLTGWIPNDIVLPKIPSGNNYFRNFIQPQDTYFLSCTADFSTQAFVNGITGTGHMDPSFQRPDRRHRERSAYIMTYADGHSETTGFYQRSLKFPEWIGNPYRMELFKRAYEMTPKKEE